MNYKTHLDLHCYGTHHLDFQILVQVSIRGSREKEGEKEGECFVKPRCQKMLHYQGDSKESH